MSLQMLICLVAVAAVCGAPTSQDLLAAERKFADNIQSRETSVVGGVVASEGSITNIRVTSDIPHILSIDPNYAHLNVVVYASLGTVVVEGKANISSSGFSGSIAVTYVNVSVSGIAGIIVVQNVLQVSHLDAVYSPQNRSSRVAFDVTPDRDLGQAAQTFFEEAVERLVSAEMDRRLTRQINDVLKSVSSLEVFGDGTTVQRTKDFNPISNVNLMVDTLLAMMLPRIPTAVRLDDISRSFKKTFLFVPIFGQLTATNGTLRDLKTLRRTSDMLLNVTSSGLRLIGAMGLQTLHFAYDYDVSVLDMGPRGHLEGTLGNNSLSFALAISYDGRGGCTVHVEQLRFTTFDDFKIKVTGVGVLNWLASSITTSVINDSKDKIVEHIESSLKGNLKSTADKIGFCNILQGQ
ncbi:hypothetical protein PR048_003946 [Dryococelus australis]|uniref:Uncharacterized protein n=1 Tax=Dryococelus australis TaxID=614101 RepID=A0ABQ9I427_9NEOP|nr:hypothetical protein PR048_003946 [Dryococelus australis]